ncbi:hypothetical protein AWH56_26785 [Anaerobacillus isosaccharinicus]|uniref:Uncharacterized protein n=2 Tax=Anaerobacillus isosaccharinicus TaxID=1532552 RepID=A0A1S2LCQ5_9BACI|nr:hypothetical protein [Anaerobacillus isosaccharinicus]
MNIIIIVLLFLLNIRYQSFKHLKKYAPTMVYVSTFNALYYYLCKHYLLWDFKSINLSVRWLRGLHIFILTPSLVLLYLTKFPRKIEKQPIYILKWVAVSSICEFIVFKQGLLFFKRGWNIGWSALLYLKMYVYSYFFKEHKLTVLGLSIITTVTALKIFNVPLRNDQLKGPLAIPFLKKKKKFISF